MLLKDRVCNFELAKKLEELGVKQESLWIWISFGHGEYKIFSRENLDKLLMEGTVLSHDIKEQYSAFSVSELGEMLPDDCSTMKEKSKWYIFCTNRMAINIYKDKISLQECDTEANARAKMLIWLIENKKLEVNNENR